MSTAVATNRTEPVTATYGGNATIRPTALTVPVGLGGNSSALSVYNRIDNPLQFVEQFGKSIADSGMFGCKNAQQGQVLAMTCICEGITPTDFCKQYHIIEGKISMRADAMLANFRKAGGRHRWLEIGDEGQRATLELSYDNETITVAYSIDQARKAGLVKDKSNWDKDPGSMLRARCISRGIRMIAPEIVAGVYAPEDLGEEPIHVAAIPAATTKPRKATATATVNATTIEAAPAPVVVDAEVVEPQQTTTEQPAEEPAPVASVTPAQVEVGTSQLDPKATSAADTDPCTEVQLGQIRSLLTDIQKADPQIPAKIQGKLQGMGKSKLSELSISEAAQLIQALYVKASELAV